MTRTERIEKKILKLEKIVEDIKVLKSKTNKDGLESLELWLNNGLEGWENALIFV
jgi:hypothetical protein